MAVALNIPPREVWSMDPQDLATIVAVLEERAEAAKKR